jgi:hypothetical protein
MWQFIVNGKVYKFKTLKEARFMAQFNDSITIISKVVKVKNDQTIKNK